MNTIDKELKTQVYKSHQIGYTWEAAHMKILANVKKQNQRDLHWTYNLKNINTCSEEINEYIKQKILAVPA